MASYNDTCTHSDPSIYTPNLQIDTKKYTKSNSVHGLYKYSHYDTNSRRYMYLHVYWPWDPEPSSWMVTAASFK